MWKLLLAMLHWVDVDKKRGTKWNGTVDDAKSPDVWYGTAITHTNTKTI
jgi:hypothetical protein